MTEVRDTTPEEWARYLADPLGKASRGAVAVATRDLSGLVEGPGGRQETTLGPGLPILPVVPPEGAPRVWDYPAGYNVQQRPRAYESVSFDTLRAMSNNYDVARIAIETRIAEIRALDWAIIPRTIQGQSRKEAAERRKSLTVQMNAAEKFFLKPDGVSDFGTWVSEWLDDLLSIDAPVLYPRMTLGGGLHGLEIIDGSTIRPIINLHGYLPAPPDPAYGQVIKGQTWGLYTLEELYYTPYRRRPRSPYGYPPLEWVLLTVNRALRRQTLDLSMYTEGTMPVSFYRMPEDWTGTQLQELQKLLDEIMAGNDAVRSRVRLMPGGTGTGLERINPEPKNEVEEWLMTITAAAFGVNPVELGFQPRGIGLGGKGFQEAQEAINYRKNLRPLGRHMKYIFDDIIERYIDPNLEWQWTGLIEEADQLKQAQTDEIYWRIGVYSSDFIASKQDVDPPGLGHIIAYNGNVIPVQQIIDTYGEFGDQFPVDAADVDTDDLPTMAPALPKSDGQMDTPNQPSQTQGVAGVGEPTAKASAAGDLAAWRRKAVNRVKMGKAASAPFRSDTIDPETARVISSRLERARTVEEVKAAFEGGGTGTPAPFDASVTPPSTAFGPSSLRASLLRASQYFSDLESPSTAAGT